MPTMTISIQTKIILTITATTIMVVEIFPTVMAVIIMATTIIISILEIMEIFKIETITILGHKEIIETLGNKNWINSSKVEFSYHLMRFFSVTKKEIRTKELCYAMLPLVLASDYKVMKIKFF